MVVMVTICDSIDGDDDFGNASCSEDGDGCDDGNGEDNTGGDSSDGG